jgi:DNA-binding NtrC family response regulator
MEAKKTGKTLLLSGSGDQTWEKHLRMAIEILNKELDVATEMAIDDLPWSDYDLVILDAGAISNMTEIISQVRAHNMAARIILFSSSPTWKQAREAMQAGAMDYAPKVLQRDQILAVIRRGLTKQISETPKQS